MRWFAIFLCSAAWQPGCSQDQYVGWKQGKDCWILVAFDGFASRHQFSDKVLCFLCVALKGVIAPALLFLRIPTAVCDET